MASDLRERVRALRGMDRLLPALDGLPPVFLVGGAVRDLLRGAPGVDLDLAVEGDGPATARALAERLRRRPWSSTGASGPPPCRAPELRFDIAATRRERYPQPGALPEVEAASLEEDLGRRDFTINAMAHPPHRRRLRAPARRGERPGRPAGRRSCASCTSAASRTTPRGCCGPFATRRGSTSRWTPTPSSSPATAVADGALETVSGARIGDELLDLLAESDAPAAVERLRALGLDAALHPALDADPVRVASAALGAG